MPAISPRPHPDQSGTDAPGIRISVIYKTLARDTGPDAPRKKHRSDQNLKRDRPQHKHKIIANMRRTVHNFKDMDTKKMHDKTCKKHLQYMMNHAIIYTR